MFGSLSDEHLRYALGKTGGKSAELAAAFVLEREEEGGGIAAEYDAVRAAAEARRAEESARRGAQEARAAAQAKAAAMARYDEREDDAGRRYRPSLPPEVAKELPKGTKVVKYLEGKPVHVRPSEKYIVEKDPDEPPGPPPTTLKIKKKGQGGASPGFK